MKYYSLNDKVLERQKQYEGYTYDLFKPTVVDMKLNGITKYFFVVTIEYEGRLDKISEFLYDGENKYVEELMKINNLYNPYCVKTGDIINYISVEDMYALYDESTDDSNKIDVMNINNPKSTVKDPNRQNDVLPTVVKDKRVKQVYWNKDNKTVTINNKLN